MGVVTPRLSLLQRIFLGVAFLLKVIQKKATFVLNRAFINSALVFVFGFFAQVAHACPTCGQSFSFTPRTMAISFGFFLMPVFIVLIFVWRIRRSDRIRRQADPGHAEAMGGSSGADRG